MKFCEAIDRTRQDASLVVTIPQATNYQAFMAFNERYAYVMFNDTKRAGRSLTQYNTLTLEIDELLGDGWRLARITGTPDLEHDSAWEWVE